MGVQVHPWGWNRVDCKGDLGNFGGGVALPYLDWRSGYVDMFVTLISLHTHVIQR